MCYRGCTVRRSRCLQDCDCECERKWVQQSTWTMWVAWAHSHERAHLDDLRDASRSAAWRARRAVREEQHDEERVKGGEVMG